MNGFLRWQALAAVAVGLLLPVAPHAAAAPVTAPDRGTAIVSVAATYFDSSGRVVTRTPAVSYLSATCRSGQMCGRPQYAGCVTWQVWRTEVHQDIKDYRYEVDVHFCWQNHRIRRKTLTVTASLSHINPIINDNGNTESDNAFYPYFSGITYSGHLSKYQRHVQYCGASICYASEDPWIHEYVHGDGTMDFHTGKD